ncbi:MAG: GNVR domain-containing protein [Candidatus Woesearchaeota archaeon]
MKEEEVDFQHYIRLLRKYWIVSAITFIIVLGAVLAYTFLKAPTYEAKSLVAITSQDQSSFLLGSSVPKVSDLETQRLVIQGSGVMNTIYSQYGVGTFLMSVNVIKNSNVIEIIVDTSSADRAALIANDIAEAYVKYTRDMRTADANEVIGFVDEQIALYDDELDALNRKIITYQSTTLNTAEKLEYQSLLREQTAKNKVYDSLLSKREEARLITSLESGNVNIISHADMPTVPIKPNIPLNVVLGAILAFGAAMAAALLIEKA